MKIEIFGPGCSKCNSLEKTVKEAVSELNLAAEVVKISDIGQMVERGVMLTPALFVDGNKILEGRVPNLEAIKKILKGE